MSKANSVRIALMMDRATMRSVPSMRAALKKEKNRAIDAQLDYYKNAGTFSQTIEQEHAAAIKSIFKKYLQPVFKGVIKVTDQSLASAMKAGGISLETKRMPLHDQYLGEWIENESAVRIALVARTTFDDMRRLMRSAFEGGDPARTVIAQGAKAKGFSAARANTIARTETHNAAQYAAIRTSGQLASEVGVTLKKEWIPVSDERTRPDHMAMLGSAAIGYDDDFVVGGERMDRPGDPSASPENTINCRCAVVFVPDF